MSKSADLEGEIHYSKFRAQNVWKFDKRTTMNSRQMGVALIATIIFEIVVALFLFGFYIINALLTNAVFFTIIIALYVASLEFRHGMDELDTACRTNNVHFIAHFVSIVSPIDYAWNFTLDLTDLAKFVWDYTYGLLMLVVHLFYVWVVPLFIYMFKTWGNYFYEFGLMFV